MRSSNVDRFNHDEDAADYDLDVRNASDPIRAGYEELLRWVVERSAIGEDATVLELGSGTGNLTARLPVARRIVCVDISSAMTQIARAKLLHRSEIEWLRGDLLEIFERPLGRFDRVVSTYALHHLTDAEKSLFFEKIREVLVSGGRAVFGDLAFESAGARAALVERWRSQGETELVETIEDEYFWSLESARSVLEGLGFEVSTRRFSELSWGVLASLRSDS